MVENLSVKGTVKEDQRKKFLRTITRSISMFPQPIRGNFIRYVSGLIPRSIKLT